MFRWELGPQLGEVAVHLGLESEQWLLHNPGCHLSPPLAGLSRPEEHDRLLGCMWGWWYDGDRETEILESSWPQWLRLLPPSCQAVLAAWGLMLCVPLPSVKGEENEGGPKSLWF